MEKVTLTIFQLQQMGEPIYEHVNTILVYVMNFKTKVKKKSCSCSEKILNFNIMALK